MFAIALLPGLAAMATLILKVREIPPHEHEEHSDSPSSTACMPEILHPLPKRFYIFVAIVAIFTLGNSSDLFLLLYGWERFHLSLLAIIGLWIALHISKIAFSFPGGLLSDRLGRRSTIIAGWTVYALVYLGFAFASSPRQFWLLFIAYGFYYGMSEGSEKALVADFIESEHRGTAYGIYNGTMGLAALPGSLMFGIFWAVIGPGWAFGIGASLAALAALLLMALQSATHTLKAPS
jgi:MFS family permease